MLNNYPKYYSLSPFLTAYKNGQKTLFLGPLQWCYPLIYGQRKNFIELKKVLLIRKNVV